MFEEIFYGHSFAIGSLIIFWLVIENKKFLAILFAVISFLWIMIYDFIVQGFSGIGVDSLFEVQHLGWDETFFFVSTIGDLLEPRYLRYILIYLVCGVVALGIYKAIQWLIGMFGGGNKKTLITVSSGIGIMIISLLQSHSEIIWLISKNSTTFLNVRENFNNKIPRVSFDKKGIDVVVYIGESTSMLNMGLYGYFRDTTPYLSDLREKDEKFLVFENVFSTHTHTSPSLLEALSFEADDQMRILPIFSRKRISLISVLNENKVKTFLISNQGMAGSWNMASSIIFDSGERIFSVYSALAGKQGL